MKRITPIGYSQSSMGKALSVITIILGALIIFGLVQAGASVSVMLIPAIVTVILAAVFRIADGYANKKNRSRIEYMEYMLSCPSVNGELVELKEIPYFFGREIEDPPKTNAKVYINGKHRVYRIVASFYSPVTGRKEKAISASYNYSVMRIKEKGSISVHYTPDGEYWIEAEV